MIMTTPLSLLEELESALAAGTAERRLQTLWRVTDLFLATAGRYSDDQVGLFDDVLTKLTTAIEAKARAKLATRLATVPNAPPRVIKALAFDDDISVAEPVLARSERLEEADLVVTASTTSQQHLYAISQRAALSEAVTDVLVNRGDQRVVHSVARNSGARFSNAGFRVLVQRAADDDTLATTVGLRRDIPRHHLLKLIERASVVVRERLAADNPFNGQIVDGVVTEVAGTIRSEARNASADFTAAKAETDALHRAGRLNEDLVYGFARERKFEHTTVALSLLCVVPIEVVERALLDDGTEIVLILAKVAGFSWTTAKAILLLRAAGRGMSAQDLEQAHGIFRRLQIETARRVLHFYHARRKGSDQPAAMADMTQRAKSFRAI
jgi:uncharacterized protein (DUF2336 family)